MSKEDLCQKLKECKDRETCERITNAILDENEILRSEIDIYKKILDESTSELQNAAEVFAMNGYRITANRIFNYLVSLARIINDQENTNS